MNQRTIEYWLTRPEIYEMTYREFLTEYQECMTIARLKEKNPNLELTPEEKAMNDIDWRQFSRYRGYTEHEIAEYSRWHKISGQTDKLENAINDPWRKDYPIWDSRLYVKHIEKALELNIPLGSIILENYKMVKAEINQFDNENMIQQKPLNNNQTQDYEIAPSEWNDIEIPEQIMIG